MSREMATEMNVEAERAAFEAWATGPEWNWTMDAMWKTASGEYGETETRREWEIWQAARRAAQPADVGAGELPPLPSDKLATTYDADQMRQYAREAIAADRRARRKHASCT